MSFTYQDMLNQVKPRPGFKVIWVPDPSSALPHHQWSEAYWHTAGATPVILSKPEREDPAKRAAKVGGLNLTADGRVKVGDVVAYEIPLEVAEKRVQETFDKYNARIRNIKKGGEAASTGATQVDFKLTKGPLDAVDDEKPDRFRKEN